MKTVRDAVGVANLDTTYIFFKRVPIQILFFNFLGTTFLIITKMHFQYRKIKFPEFKLLYRTPECVALG